MNNLPFCVCIAQIFFYFFFYSQDFCSRARKPLSHKGNNSSAGEQADAAGISVPLPSGHTTVLTGKQHISEICPYLLPTLCLIVCIWRKHRITSVPLKMWDCFLIYFFLEKFFLKMTLCMYSPWWITWDAQSWLLTPYILLRITIYRCLIRTFWFDRSKKKKLYFPKTICAPSSVHENPLLMANRLHGITSSATIKAYKN